MISFNKENKPSEGRGLLQSQQPLEPSLQALRAKLVQQTAFLKRQSKELDTSLQVNVDTGSTANDFQGNPVAKQQEHCQYLLAKMHLARAKLAKL